MTAGFGAVQEDSDAGVAADVNNVVAAVVSNDADCDCRTLRVAPSLSCVP
jgi:hypothetical protein